MATSDTPTKGNRMTVSSLLSPPEVKRYDSFSSPMAAGPPSYTPHSSFSHDVAMTASRKRSADGEGKKALPPSPPISPYAQKETSFASTVQDPPLFTGSEADFSIAGDVPLFPQENVDPHIQLVISRHMASNPSPVKPTRDEYFLAASCISVVSRNFNRDPRRWIMREHGLMYQYGAGSKVSKDKRYKKIAPAPMGTRKTKTVATPPRAPRQRAPKRTPQSAVYDSFDSPPKAPRAPTNREDTDYQSLPDFSPPIETLPKGNSKALKTDWKGQVLDLSRDPDLHMLHEAEATLAATLRLSAATYLCSKRRIFQARLEALRIGKEFRKTDAQQACKIDVNKASKLWTAYDRVGWFRRDFFVQHL